MAKHQKRFKAKKEKLQKWRMALKQVADLSGYHFEDGDAYEYKFIGSIVEELSRKISRASLHVADYPVGLESQVTEVMKLLDVGSDDLVHIIGIHGMGGLGKTTLALEVYNLIALHFDESCFLQNVREESNKHKLGHLTVLKFDRCKFLTQIPDVSDLPNLRELSFEDCESLVAVDDSIGFLKKLKKLSAYGCRKLTSFPPLNLTSLETLQLSACSSLEYFPEILGEMENIRELRLTGLYIKELPFSFQNLTGLRLLALSGCGIVQLPCSLAMMPELSSFYTDYCNRWQWIELEEGEEKLGSIISSKAQLFCATNCNLCDDFFLAGFKRFAHVGYLNLSGNNFTILPEFFKELQFLRTLDVSDCEHLQEIRGLPPILEYFDARNCVSFTSSSTSMLLNQELHEAGGTQFVFPGTRIPEWFDQQSSGPSSSFWFRNKFPAKLVFLLIAPVSGASYPFLEPKLFINGKVLPFKNEVIDMLKLDHTYIFDLQELPFKNDNLFEEVAWEKEWNHVEVRYQSVLEYENEKRKGVLDLESSLIKATGIHIFKEDPPISEIIEKKKKARYFPQGFGTMSLLPYVVVTLRNNKHFLYYLFHICSSLILHSYHIILNFFLLIMAATTRSLASIYDVFLSFRGEDTRHGFTGNLYKALDNRGIYTFIDDQELPRGDEITPALSKAIQESRIAITVLSQNYASSSFCLDELVTILHCKSEGLLVIPVFYKVDPSDVRHQKGSYGEAMAKHQKRFKAKKEKLQKWRMALHQVADLSGYHFKDGDAYEYKFIQSIVEQVSREINRAPLHVADYPVGLESQVTKVMKLLDVASHDVVHIIGIHGMGGLGKTTLAREVYNLIALPFDESCFLQNVREESNKHGLKHLQSILLSKLLGEKDITLTSWQEGASMIQHRLRRKKVLLILDDVDKREQLKAIVGRPDWFGPGSRVIVTTRDKHLLKYHGVERTYEVKVLNHNAALQLLTRNAFKRGKIDPSYEDVLYRVVTYASGLPLALEVIGSNLFEKTVTEWESALEHYKRIPSDEILEILKVSFDALGEEQKNVFLDIACCFKGYKWTEVDDILGALYGNCKKHHLGVLVEKSLIKLDLFDNVEMHDLIQDMGREIERQRSPEEPGKCKRLWLPKDIIQVLKHNTKLGHLTVLNFDGCKFLTQIPDVSDLPNLKELSFKKCESLVAVDDSIGFLNKLKKLSAYGCSKLTSFPPLNLTSLETLELSHCSSLEYFPEILGEMENIERLELNGLPIKELPFSFQNLIGLRLLTLWNCGIVQLRCSLAMMPNLFQFQIEKCNRWQWVESDEGEEKVGSIISSEARFGTHSFSAKNCNLCDDFFLTGFKRFAHVGDLNLSGNNFTILPEFFKELQFLHSLDVNDCQHLQEIRGIPPNLMFFGARNCVSLTSSSKSMLLNQELYEARRTQFVFKGASIPEWFDQQSSGHSSSFWFRNKFPAKILCLLIAPVSGVGFRFVKPNPKVFINGKFQEFEPRVTDRIKSMLKLDHTYIFDLKEIPFKNNYLSEEVAREKEWNHVEVRYESVLEYEKEKKEEGVLDLESSLIKATGIHIFREEGSTDEDIRFDDPYLSSSASESPSFLQTIALGTRKFSIAFFLFFSCFLFHYFGFSCQKFT
ncbi:TMV resistance protein N [Glycine soja]|nr:TMV resistance protein N [Glycine soja]